MNICIAQMNYNSKDIQSHVEKIKGIISRFRTHDLVIFPELMLHGHPSFERPEGFLYRKMKVVYRNVSEELYDFVAKVDARVVIGELRRRGDSFFNLATYVDRDGPQSYTKTHVHWSEKFVPGEEIMVMDTPLGPLGLCICFDAAFPEVWRVLALKGAELAVCQSAVPWSFAKEYMWRRAQGAAMFNQYYVAYANRPGPHFGGGSAVFSPRGERIAAAGPDEQLLTVSCDPAEVARWREEEPALAHRRPLLYRDLAERGRIARAAAPPETLRPADRRHQSERLPAA